jgi:hypothetical protein
VEEGSLDDDGKELGWGGAHLAGSNGDRQKQTGQDRTARFHL